MEDTIISLRDSVYKGKAEETVRYAKEALAHNILPSLILEEGMIPAMDKIGEDFSKGIAYIPDLLVAARAMSMGMDILREALVRQGVEPRGKILLGTVFGDVHDIGKKLVTMTMEGAGFAVIDLGINVTAEKFVEAYEQHRPSIIGLSALLSSTMNYMAEVIQRVRALDSSAKFIVGGAPVRQVFADKIGANGYALDAPSAVKKIKEILDIGGN